MRKVFVPLAVLRIPEGVTLAMEATRETYIMRLLEQGIEPVFISPLFPRDLIEEHYAEANGVLLMGGGDIDPAYYNEEIHPKTKKDDHARDELELMIAKRAIADKKPILGICRGIQVMAIAQGGTLYQHIPDVFPNENHGVSEGGNYDSLMKKEQHHEIILESESIIMKILGKERVMVPSGHHQAVKNCGEGFVISGLSPAGVPEIIESIDKNQFALGVQFHPEIPGEDELRAIFKAFSEAAENYSLL